MMLLLSTFRRTIEQDRMVREGRWREGRPALLSIPRLMGQTLGLVSFGHVARAVAKRAKPFGLRILAYDPFIEELVMVEHGVLPCTLEEVLSQSDFVSMHAPARPEVEGMLGEKHFRMMKKHRDLHQHRPGPDGAGSRADQGAGREVDRLCRARRAGDRAARQQQPTAEDGQRDPERTHRLGIRSLRSEHAKRHVGRELALVLEGKWPMSCVNPAVLQNTKLRRWQPVSMERGPNS